jgi:3-oxoacyl-[acyl-carrier protein] reductase
MEHKKILVTGAGSGLGKSLSCWFDGEAADLCLFSRSQEKLHALQAQLNRPAKRFPVDFYDALQLEETLSLLLADDFVPDIIVHCAGGGFKQHDPLIARKDFQRLMDVNLSSVVQINSRLLPLMIKRGSGVVIHIGSTAAHAAHGSVAYNTAKAALSAYVRSLGRAIAATGVVVTGISPGPFMAEGNNMFHFKQDKPEEFASFSASLASGCMADAEDFFSIIRTLCAQNTSLFSGCMLPVDAGEGLSYTT